MSASSITVSTATEVGVGNDVNGDAVGCCADDSIVAIADGMGGHPGGAEASRTAVSAFLDEVLSLQPSERLDDGSLRQAVLRAHDAVRALGAADLELAGLGTTLTGLVFLDGRAKIVHVGDTRAYRHRDRALRQLTTDHSLVEELVARRYVDADQAANYPLRHVLTSVLGASRQPQVDVFDVSLRTTDTLLLATDGFWGGVGEVLINETLNRADSHADPDVLCRKLMDAASGIPATDDRTLAVVRLSRPAFGGGT